MKKRNVRCSFLLLSVLLIIAFTTPALAKGPFPIQTSLWSPPTEKGSYSDLSNVGFPDPGATYWITTVTVPDGANLQLKGKFPYARYMSLTSYDAETGIASTGLKDVDIIPDPGSRNPFLPGARRFFPKRSYTVRISSEGMPSDPEPNTLYAGVAGQRTILLIYRIYVQNMGRDLTGGVGLPEAYLTLADGTLLTGDAASAALNAVNETVTPQPLPPPFYDALRNVAPLQYGVDPETFPSANPPLFYRAFNIPHWIGCVYGPFAAAIGGPAFECTDSPTVGVGQWATLDNAYIAARASLAYGEVLVLRGEMPTTPRTRAGWPIMKEKQVRYWSMTTNESLVTTRVADGVFDEQVPLDRDRMYTIVISRPEDRPRNAYWCFGVAWLSTPEQGDGAGTVPGAGPAHLNDLLIIMRNMLPGSDFGHAIQDVSTPADLETVLGPYLPTGEYMSKADFEDLGFCPHCK